MDKQDKQDKQLLNSSLLKTLKNSQAGFSLLEILIALTLLAIAGSFVAGRIFEMLHEGKVKAARIQMNSLGERLMEYRRHCYTYPTTDQGLQALVKKPSGGVDCKNYAPNGYLEGDVPKDPWENDYVYTSDGQNFNIISYGSDRAEGGTGEGTDISLRENKPSN